MRLDRRTGWLCWWRRSRPPTSTFLPPFSLRSPRVGVEFRNTPVDVDASSVKSFFVPYKHASLLSFGVRFICVVLFRMRRLKVFPSKISSLSRAMMQWKIYPASVYGELFLLPLAIFLSILHKKYSFDYCCDYWDIRCCVVCVIVLCPFSFS